MVAYKILRKGDKIMDANKNDLGMQEVLELQKLQADDGGIKPQGITITTVTVTIFWSTISNNCKNNK